MDIFSVIMLIGGLAFFLFGMNILSEGLEKLAGGTLERSLRRMTSNRFKSLLLGVGITAAIQSSSAVTVMLVGLVNSGVMELSQSVGVIMGSNIGTTMTAWILSLAGIESGNIFIKLLKPENFSLVFAMIGVVMIMAGKTNRKKATGSILVGFAILMYGMKMMSSAVSPLKDMEQFTSMLTAFKNPLFGVLAGTVITAVIQSSSASVGILQALALTGGITYGMAIPIIMGQNIGTCISALISSIGANSDAKRVTAVHVEFNIIGTAVCLTVFTALKAIFGFQFVDDSIGVVGIAVCHSAFNIVTTAMLFPFAGKLTALARIIVKDGEEKKAIFIDERLLRTPSLAVGECASMTLAMGEAAAENIFAAIGLTGNYDEKRAASVVDQEEIVDEYEDAIGTYLAKLSGTSLTDEDSSRVSRLLHSIGDFERMSDHAVNIMEAAREIYEKKIEFSEEAEKELSTLKAALTEVVNNTMTAFRGNDVEMAESIEPLEEVIDLMTDEIKTRHIERLQGGRCTVRQGFVLSDLLTNMERVSDHCSNIAIGIIETIGGGFDAHAYLNSRKIGNDARFVTEYEHYEKKYAL